MRLLRTQRCVLMTTLLLYLVAVHGYDIFHLVNVPHVVCAEKPNNYVDIVLDIESLTDVQKQAPHVVSFFRQDQETCTIEYSVYDSKSGTANIIIAKNEVILAKQKPARRLEATADAAASPVTLSLTEEDMRRLDEQEDLDFKDDVESFEDKGGDIRSAAGRQLAARRRGSSSSRPAPRPAPRPSPPPAASTTRRRAGSSPPASRPSPPPSPPVVTSARRRAGAATNAAATNDNSRRRAAGDGATQRRRASPESARRRGATPPANDIRRRATGATVNGKDSRFQNSNGNAYAYSSGTGGTSLNSGYNGRQPQSQSYGYSGANARPAAASSSNTGMKIAAAAGAGLLVGGVGMYAYSRMNSNNNDCNRGSYSGNCGDCYSRYSRSECYKDTGYDRPLGRDDIMTEGFIPYDYFNPVNNLPITVRISSIAGASFTKTNTCPSMHKGWNETVTVCQNDAAVTDKSVCNWKPKEKDIFFTLTQMEPLEDRLSEDVSVAVSSGGALSLMPVLLAVILSHFAFKRAF